MINDIPSASATPPSVFENVGIVIASTGRPEQLGHTLNSIAGLRVWPAVVVVSVLKESDFPPQVPSGLKVRLLVSPKAGWCGQLNHGVENLPESVRTVCCLDDDVYLHPDYLVTIHEIFAHRPEVVALRSNLIRNGNITDAEAIEALASWEPPLTATADGYRPIVRRETILYGCAMSFRKEAYLKEPMDETLAQSCDKADWDIAFRMKRLGGIGFAMKSALVHLAVQKARTREVRFGYAQMANLFHFFCLNRGFPRDIALGLMLRLTVTNGLFAVFPQADRFRNFDRAGRFQGNLMGWWDVIRGRSHPRNILNMK